MRVLEERLARLMVLEDAVHPGGSDAAAAALVRLAAALGERDATTMAAAALRLRRAERDGLSALVEALYTARWRGDYESAELLISAHRERAWAKTARLHLAIRQDRWASIERAMVELGEAGPGQLLQLLLLPARDPKATPIERLGIYRMLLRLLRGRLVNRAFARAVHRAWMGSSSCRLGWSAGAPQRLIRAH